MVTKIGITGTKGKSTTMFLIKHCLVEDKKNVISVSSTEGMYYNNKLLRKVFAHDYFDTENYQFDFFLSEATSYMLKQNHYNYRIQNIAIYTGIEETEHTEIHTSFQDYLLSKKKLFDNTKITGLAVVNSDDKYYNVMLNDFYGKVIKVGFNETPNCKIDIISINRDYMKIKLNYNNENVWLTTKLLGDFNARNIAMAYITCLNLGIKKENILKYLESFEGIKGRHQKIDINNNSLLIIDYAHTDGSLKAMLKLLNELYPEKNIITIFGCGGDKSKEKRPLMGKYSVELSDEVILTTDNPRNEDPKKIINDIISGISQQNYKVIENRKDAIKYAIKKAYNSVILLAGKGSEEYCTIGSNKLPQSDENLVKKVLSELKTN